MSLVGIVTLVGVFATVAVLATYLITVAIILKHVNFTLGTIIAGLRAIANQTEPLAPIMNEITGDLQALQSNLEGLVRKKTAQKQPG